ncbi:U11/U12 small nuclear ribonucleoprotein 35 kDa protein-like [Topomyia yanbarensis]|uniref:U11/U12 small nuclear ribonucleoprotein 35 kDa protein-like n=1 Tax=Topomyia yanbarensis TaxID=2498891 RepID=UPI00273B7EEA|nr:U11/U12 small nuclear ribonucleoprotein 35 kDa protein-like [Topomyia yanbarensis]
MSSGDDRPSDSKTTWSKYAENEYDPIRVGSIDGTDEFPHDRALIRAMESRYKPNDKVVGDSYHTVFVGRLNYSVSEERIRELFERFGEIVRCRLVRDIETGLSRGYAFVEYKRRRHAKRAIVEMHGRVVNGKEILVDEEWERRLKNWKPRRLGGGFGGMKKSQQLRFGCKTRPWKQPVTCQKYSSKNEFFRQTKQQREILSKVRLS